MCLVILLEHLQHGRVGEHGVQCLILTVKSHANQAIPLGEIDWWWWVFGLDAHYRRIDLGRRFEIVFAHLNQVGHVGKQLCIDRQAAVPGTQNQNV